MSMTDPVKLPVFEGATEAGIGKPRREPLGFEAVTVAETGWYSALAAARPGGRVVARLHHVPVAEQHGLVGLADEGQVGIGFREHRDGAYTQAARRTNHPASDLAPIGHEERLDHSEPFYGSLWITLWT